MNQLYALSAVFQLFAYFWLPVLTGASLVAFAAVLIHESIDWIFGFELVDLDEEEA